MTKEEFVAAGGCAADFDRLDLDGSGTLERRELEATAVGSQNCTESQRKTKENKKIRKTKKEEPMYQKDKKTKTKKKMSSSSDDNNNDEKKDETPEDRSEEEKDEEDNNTDQDKSEQTDPDQELEKVIARYFHRYDLDGSGSLNRSGQCVRFAYDKFRLLLLLILFSLQCRNAK